MRIVNPIIAGHQWKRGCCDTIRVKNQRQNMILLTKSDIIALILLILLV
jgi:hypothetical protein